MINPLLPNKPLVEAIFDLRWDTGPQNSGFKNRVSSLLFSRFYDFARENGYLHIQSLPTAELPDEMVSEVVQYQFCSAPDNIWPLIQLGPGILTVNETMGYKWETFLPRVLSTIKELYKSYPTELSELRTSRANLTYINSVPYNPANQGKLHDFLKNNFHVTAGINQEAFQQLDAEAMKLSISYTLQNPKGVGAIIIGNGLANGKPIIRWETTVQSKNEDVPKNPEGYNQWLESSHKILSDWFYSLCGNELLESFKGDN